MAIKVGDTVPSATFTTFGASGPGPVTTDDLFMGDDVLMLADGNGDFTRAVGLELDASGFGMGKRSQRYSILVDDGVVKEVNVEQGREFNVSSAEYMLAQL